MKHYLFLIESISVNCGGPARVAALVSGMLAERGHSVELIHTIEAGELVDLHPKIKVHKIKSSKSNPFIWLKAASILREKAKIADAVIVSGMWGPIDGFALRIANIPSIKLYIRTCGMLEDYILNKSIWKKKLARLFYVNTNLNRATQLLVNTEIEASHIKALGIKSSIKVITNGISANSSSINQYTFKDALTTLNIEESGSVKYLLYLGRIHPKKGLDLLLPAFADFRKSNPCWKLLVAGSFSDQSYETKIQNLVKDLDLGANGIKFLGEVKGQDKLASFRLASAFILPSLSEGFSNAVIEAMAWELPVIITSKCNFPQISQYDAGVVCEPDTYSIQEALFKLLPNNNMVLQYGKNAKKLVTNNYNIDTIVDIYEELAI